MKKRTIGSMLCAGLVLFTLQSKPAEALLAGVKITGMAATGVSHPIDAFAGVYNPAGITVLPDRLDSGISWVQTYGRGRVRDLPTYPAAVLAQFPPPVQNGTGGVQPSDFNQGYNGAKTADIYVPEFGVNKNWCFNTCNGPLEVSTGIIVHNRNDLKTTYGRAFTLFGTSPMGLEYIHQTAAFVFATKFCNMHSFGISFNYNLQRLKINGLEKFTSDPFSVSPQDTTDRGYSYSNGWGLIVGYLFEWDCFKAGAAYHPKTTMNKFKKYSGFVADHGAFDIPERFTTGVSIRPMKGLTFAFDYEYIHWRGIRQLRNPIFPNLSLSATDDRYLLGAYDGPGFGFNNQNFYRFGAEYEVNRCFTVRAGFRHSPSPIPNEFTAVNLLTLDCMEDVLCFGGTWRMSQCYEVSFFYGIGFTKKIKGKNSIPVNVPQPAPDGAPYFGRLELPINSTVEADALTFERADGEVDIKQRRVALGVSLGWYF